MLKFNTMTTAIRIKNKTIITNENGFEEEIWVDLIDEDIFCEWQNKFGGELYSAAAVNAKEPAKIRLWYIPGIGQTCRVKRVEDEAIFDIINIDDIQGRHQQLEIEVKRYIEG